MSGGFEVQPMERHENTARKRIWESDREEPNKYLGWLKIPIQEDDDESHVRSDVAREPDCLIDLSTTRRFT